MEIVIGHLYPKEMNLYGDLGNVICLQKRLEWRNIASKVIAINIGDQLPNNIDLFFFGGGQDNDQLKVYPDLLSVQKKLLITELLDRQKPILAICGGYQLLGNYFLTGDNQRMPGLGVIPIETVAPGKDMVHRAVGNLVTELLPNSPIRQHADQLNTLVGFENHSGRTRFIDNTELQPLGKVLVGTGDNEDKISDGVIYKNIIGSYMHGSVLPKNPHLADFLLSTALLIKYQKDIVLEKLDDSAEIAAHRFILQRFKLQ